MPDQTVPNIGDEVVVRGEHRDYNGTVTRLGTHGWYSDMIYVEVSYKRWGFTVTNWFLAGDLIYPER